MAIPGGGPLPPAAPNDESKEEDEPEELPPPLVAVVPVDVDDDKTSEAEKVNDEALARALPTPFPGDVEPLLLGEEGFASLLVSFCEVETVMSAPVRRCLASAGSLERTFSSASRASARTLACL